MPAPRSDRPDRDDGADANRWQHHRTDRLTLDRVAEGDIDGWHSIHADPRVWTHFPSGQHTDRSMTEELVRSSMVGWREVGLGYWSVRGRPRGPVIGCGGCRPVADKHRWNLYYRFSPEAQGLGYASEVASAAITAAHAVDKTRPVVAIMLETNPGSWRVAEKVGLIRIWEGPDEGNPDPTAIRLVYADRPDIGRP